MSEMTPILKLTNHRPHEAIGIAAGYISFCWESPAGAGVFDAERAAAAVDELSAYLRDRVISRMAEIEGDKVALVRCPHRTGLCFYTDGMLHQLPCDCNDKSEILEIYLLRSKLPVGASLGQIEEWLGRDD